jgi:OmpA-OmpF porin, OOP family
MQTIELNDIQYFIKQRDNKMRNKMKVYLTALVLLFAISVTQAQIASDSWAFGFGGAYPRFVSVNLQPRNSNYGAFLSLQRNFSEHVGLRLKGGYYHMQGEWTDASANSITETTNLISGNLDMLYYLVPCKSVSPYLVAGAGIGMRSISDYPTRWLDQYETTMAFSLGVGVEWKIAPDWRIVTEYSYHRVFNSELDGTVADGEVNGCDSYYSLSLGLLYYFGKGEPSKLCEPPKGMTEPVVMKDMTDYNKIEEMIIKHIPKEIVKDVIVDRYIMSLPDDRLVLVGVNFAFDKSELLPESYPVLDKAVKLLNDKPEINVEIQGYCDYIGSDVYNQELSEDRAQTVKTYLVSKGIAVSRLSTVGYGKKYPIEDNKTEEGRAMNRRIVFKIIK